MPLANDLLASGLAVKSCGWNLVVNIVSGQGCHKLRVYVYLKIKWCKGSNLRGGDTENQHRISNSGGFGRNTRS